MKCLTKVINSKDNIQYGDILVYSDVQAFLLMHDFSDEYEAKAIQIFNNGNDELGQIDYSGKYIDELVDKIYKNFGKPEKIINIKDASVQF
jgi:hypothetical protein